MDWQRLARAVVARRVELGHRTRRSFIVASKLGARTVGDLETGRRSSYDPATLARLERALEWPAGHARAILLGLEDVKEEEPELELIAVVARLLAPDGPLSPVERRHLTIVLDAVLAPYR